MREKIRKGTVISIDQQSGLGTIRDENGEEIEFELNALAAPKDVRQQITFVIRLINNRLMADQVQDYIA